MGETNGTVERELRAALRDCLAALRAWTAWEAGIINDGGCWGPDGLAEYPTITEPHFDALVPGLQERRNAAVRRATAALGGPGAEKADRRKEG